MSMVDTWSIWMATLSFMDSPCLAVVLSEAKDDVMPSVKPAAQFLQQGRGALAEDRVGLGRVGGEEALEGGDRGAPVVEAGIDLARFEQQLRPVGRNGQHALERARGARPVLALGEPQADVVLQPQQHVAIGHRI